ncbi:hypothetical protein [Streptomyces olivaceus]
MTQRTGVVVVGGGHHLRRQGLGHVILDADAAPGGPRRHMWDSTHLFKAHRMDALRRTSCAGVRAAVAPGRQPGSGSGQPRRSSMAAMAATTDGATFPRCHDDRLGLRREGRVTVPP